MTKLVHIAEDDIAFTGVRKPFGWLGNMAPYPVVFDGQKWPRSEHLFQALRFSQDQHVIREAIRAEPNPMKAKFLARSYAEKFFLEPQGFQDVQNMRRVLWLKLQQHPDLARQLLATDDRKIIEDVTSRHGKGSARFWGAARTPDGWEGDNMLGELWMILRDELK